MSHDSKGSNEVPVRASRTLVRDESDTRLGSGSSIQQDISNMAGRPIIYRPEIDGLRAIAVLLVLTYHAGLSIFPAGFIGVDIFFVISGFLTTSIVLNAIDRGKFSFFEFYKRRIWRLQPAVIALMGITLISATVFYLPDDYRAFIKSERAVSQFVANQFFAHETSGYATADSAGWLLLHTWSLAIEWQWYLILPLGIWLLNRF